MHLVSGASFHALICIDNGAKSFADRLMQLLIRDVLPEQRLRTHVKLDIAPMPATQQSKSL